MGKPKAYKGNSQDGYTGTYSGGQKNWKGPIWVDENGIPILTKDLDNYDTNNPTWWNEVQNQNMDAPGITTRTEPTPEERYRSDNKAAMSNPANPYSAALGWIGANYSAIPLTLGATTAPVLTGLGVVGDFIGQYGGNKMSDVLFKDPDKPFKLNVDLRLTPRQAIQQGTGFALGSFMPFIGNKIYNSPIGLAYEMNRAKIDYTPTVSQTSRSETFAGHDPLSTKQYSQTTGIKQKNETLNTLSGSRDVTDPASPGPVRVHNTKRLVSQTEVPKKIIELDLSSMGITPLRGSYIDEIIKPDLQGILGIGQRPQLTGNRWPFNYNGKNIMVNDYRRLDWPIDTKTNKWLSNKEENWFYSDKYELPIVLSHKFGAKIRRHSI